MPRPGHEVCSWCGQLLKRSGSRWKDGLLGTAFLAPSRTWTGHSFSSIGTGECRELSASVHGIGFHLFDIWTAEAMALACRFGGEPAGRQTAMPHMKSYSRYRSASRPLDVSRCAHCQLTPYE